MNKFRDDDFVTIFLEGLMISCFNSIENRFETAILRKSDHDFILRIAKYKNGELIEELEHNDFALDGIRFEINGKGNTEVNGFRKFEVGNFTRTDETLSDKNDLRWLIDIEGEEFHNSKLEPTGESITKHKMYLTPLFIENAEFFVSGLTTYENDIVEKDKDEQVVRTEFFGKYGFIMGARINSDSVQISLEGSDISFEELNKSEGYTYKIFFTNTREGGDEESELPVYYKVVKDQSGKHFTLDKRDENEVEMYWRTGNCGKVILGKTDTIESLS